MRGKENLSPNKACVYWVLHPNRALSLRFSEYPVASGKYRFERSVWYETHSPGFSGVISIGYHGFGFRW
jgi:hypothetical protein